MDPGIQVNTWTGSVSPPMVAAARLPPATEDMVTLEDVYTDEEKLHCSLLSSESAFLLFNTAVHPASATDSGEEESDDSLAPPTSTQYHPSKEESVDRAVITLTYGSDNVDRIDRIIDRTACSDINRQQHALNADAVLHNSTVEDSNWTGIQKAAVLQCEIKRCEPHDATVRIQSWWRGHRTRVRKQQEEDQLQRRVQEEAVKFLWKQLQVMLEWQSSINEQLNVAKSIALDPSIPAATPIHTEISIPESGFHSPGELQAALDNSLSSTATTGSPETVCSIGPLMAAIGDSHSGSLLEQYLSSIQGQDMEEEEDKGPGDRT